MNQNKQNEYKIRINLYKKQKIESKININK